MALFVLVIHSTLPNGFSRVIVLNDWLITLVSVGAFRFGIRTWDDFLAINRPSSDGSDFQRNVLIIGAGAAARLGRAAALLDARVSERRFLAIKYPDEA